MGKCINLCQILGYLFDQDRLVQKAEKIISALLEARSVRLSAIAEKMSGLPVANYKAIQRFLARVDLKMTLRRFLQEEAEFAIGDQTTASQKDRLCGADIRWSDPGILVTGIGSPLSWVIQPDQITYLDLIKPPDPEHRRTKWKHYSGLFVLLKQRLRILPDKLLALHRPILQIFACLIFGNIRSFT